MSEHAQVDGRLSRAYCGRAGGREKGGVRGGNAKMEVAKLPRWPCQSANTRTKCVAGEGLRIGLLDIILERETGLSRPAILRVRNGKGYTRDCLGFYR
jgi:hypothetical protein